MAGILDVSDGTFGVIGLLFGLLDMSMNHCPNEGCLAKNEVQAYNTFSMGETYFQQAHTGEELYYRRDTGKANGPFQHIWGFSASKDGEFWIGAGQSWTQPYFKDRGYMQFHAMTGLYENGNGTDIGGPIMFRTGIEIGYKAKNDVRIGLGFDHRSHLGIHGDNPGLETLHFRVSIPTK